MYIEEGIIITLRKLFYSPPRCLEFRHATNFLHLPTWSVTERGHTAPGILKREGSRKVEKKGGLLCKSVVSIHSTQNGSWVLPHASGFMFFGEQIIFEAISAEFDTRFPWPARTVYEQMIVPFANQQVQHSQVYLFWASESLHGCLPDLLNPKSEAWR